MLPGAVSQSSVLQKTTVVSEMAPHIGTHTMSPCSLPTLTLEPVRHELSESKARLEQQVGLPVSFLAYLYGAPCDRGPSIARMTAESGYVCAVSTTNGTNVPGIDPSALRRTGIDADGRTYVFGKVVAGALDNRIILTTVAWSRRVLNALNPGRSDPPARPEGRRLGRRAS